MGKVYQRFDDAADTVGLLEYVPGRVLDLLGIGLVFQVLGQAGDARDGVADFMGNPGGEAADRGQALVVQQLLLQQLEVGYIFHQDNRIGARRTRVVGDGLGLVQADPAGPFRVRGHLGFQHGVVVAPVEVPQDGAPGRRQRSQQRAQYLLRGDAGDLLHAAIPDQYLVIDAHRAHAYGQLVQGFPIVSPQVVEVRRQPGKARLRPVQLALDQVDILRGAAQPCLEGDAAFDDAVGHRGSE